MRAMQNNSQPSPLLAEAVAYHRSGRLGEASDLYRRILRANQHDVTALLSLGTLLAQQGQVAEARVLLERATAHAPERPEGWMALGNVLARAREFAPAAQAFARVVALRPNLAAAHVNLGNAQRNLLRYDLAAASYRRAIALDGRLATAQFNLGNVLADVGDLDGAVSAFERAIEIDPASLAAKTNLGNVLLRQARYAEALLRFEDVAATDSAFLRVDYNIGLALQGLGRLPLAIAAYRRAIQRDRDDLGAINNLCICLLRDAKPAEALEACARFLQCSPANRRPLAYQAAALTELDRRDEAKALLDFERLILRYPVARPSGFDSAPSFNHALAAHIQQHPTLAFEPAAKSTFGGCQTGELLAGERGPAAALEGIIGSAVDAYMRHVRSVLPDHPYVASLPQRWRLATWAVVLRNHGHQKPHFHPDGYISGVYYVSLPVSIASDSGDAGCIEFGRTEESIGGSREPLLELVRPQEGLMLLFPSYFYHRTVPFESQSPRISVAFDIIPVE